MRKLTLKLLLLGSLAASAQTLPLTPAERELLPLLPPGGYEVIEKPGSWFVPSGTDSLDPAVRQALAQSRLSGDESPSLVNGTRVRLVKAAEFEAAPLTYSAAFVEVLDGKFARKKGWVVVATMQNARAGQAATAYGSKHLQAVAGEASAPPGRAPRATNPLHTAVDAAQLKAQIKPEWLNQPNSRGRTPLMEAALRGKVENVSLLLAAGATVDALDDEGRTALYIAAAESKYEAVRVLLANGADLKVVAADGYTPLMAAARRGNLETVEYMLTAGAEVNARDPQGRTPLGLARGSKVGNWRGVERALEAAGGKE